MTPLNLSGTAYAGPERRNTTPEGLEQRRLHREAVDAGELPATKPSSLKEQLEAYLGGLPKPILVGMTSIAILAAAQQAVAWKIGVDAHLAKAEEGDRRLAATEEATKDLRQEQKELRLELREIRRDHLEESRWMAIRFDDAQRVRTLDARLKAIEGKP